MHEPTFGRTGAWALAAAPPDPVAAREALGRPREQRDAVDRRP